MSGRLRERLLGLRNRFRRRVAVARDRFHERIVALRYRLRDRVAAARRRPLATAAGVATALVLAASLAFALVPLYWLVSAALRPGDALSLPPALVPPGLTAANLVAVWTETAFPTYLRNSVVVSAGTVALTVAIATPAGYSLSRFDLPHRRAILAGLLAVQMVPLVALVTPLYRAFAAVGLLDTLTVQVLANALLAVPVGVWLVKGYVDTLPGRLEEAALVGGATRWRAFRVVVPTARPAVAATAVFAFVTSWNQFLVPLAFATSRATWTVPRGLYEFVGRRGAVDWPLLGAACLWTILPVLAVVAAFDRHLVAGLGRGFGGGRRG